MSDLDAPALPVPPVAARIWRRHSAVQRLIRFGVWLAIVIGILQSVRTIEVIPEFLLDAPEQMGDLLARMWPIDWRDYPNGVHGGVVDTLQIASLGTLLWVILAIPFGLVVASNLTRHRALNVFERVVLVSTRSVNSLVWA